MSRTFAYVRVSTAGQTAENQILEIAAAGFAVEPHRVVSETVSGSEAIARRADFSRLLDRMERGDVLVVTRLARLGRDAMDVSATVARLAGRSPHPHRTHEPLHRTRHCRDRTPGRRLAGQGETTPQR